MLHAHTTTKQLHVNPSWGGGAECCTHAWRRAGSLRKSFSSVQYCALQWLVYYALFAGARANANCCSTVEQCCLLLLSTKQLHCRLPCDRIKLLWAYMQTILQMLLQALTASHDANINNMYMTACVLIGQCSDGTASSMARLMALRMP